MSHRLPACLLVHLLFCSQVALQLGLQPLLGVDVVGDMVVTVTVTVTVTVAAAAATAPPGSAISVGRLAAVAVVLVTEVAVHPTLVQHGRCRAATTFARAGTFVRTTCPCDSAR